MCDIERNLGELTRFEVDGRRAYVIAPRRHVDSERRWIFYAPSWLAVVASFGDGGELDAPWPEAGPWPRKGCSYSHTYYLPRILMAGFHVAGVDVGASCGSPQGVVVSHHLYEKVVEDFALHPKARLMAQSNGGLVHYSWAIEHPDCVDRVFGMCPVTDMLTWPPPGLERVCGPGSIPPEGLKYDLTPEELRSRIDEFNPVSRLAPLAAHGVKILHLHGDEDDVVPLEPNSMEFAWRYHALGGEMELAILPGAKHGGRPFYESKQVLEFLLG